MNDPLILAVLALLNILLSLYFWRCHNRKIAPAQYMEFSLNGKRFRYVVPEPVNEGEFKGKYETPFIDKNGKRHVRFFTLPEEHRRSILSTLKKHNEIMQELIGMGRLFPCGVSTKNKKEKGAAP